MLATWLCLIFCGALWAQASLSGTVVNAVTLSGASAHDSPATLTDGAGKFFFAAVTPGRYRLTAGTSLELANCEQRTGMAIRLLPGAAISGRVTDEDNEPAVGAQVTSLRVSYLNGRRHPGAADHAAADDRGEYRRHSIPPGRFPPRANFERFFPPVRVSQEYLGSYHPAADLPAVNVTLRPTATHRISGTVVDSNTGQTVPEVIVMLSTAAGDEGPGRGFVRNKLGTFTFPAIAPGSYTITAARTATGQLTDGRMAVDVSQDIDNLRVRIEPGLRVEGRARMEGDGTVDPNKASVVLESNELSTFGSRSPLDADGAFAIGPMAAVMLPALSGTVRFVLVMSANGAVGAIVVFESQSSQSFRRSRCRVAISDQTGKFKLTGIAPAGCRFYAFEDIDNGKGEPVKLAGKETRTISLRTIAGGQ